MSAAGLDRKVSAQGNLDEKLDILLWRKNIFSIFDSFDAVFSSDSCTSDVRWN